MDWRALDIVALAGLVGLSAAGLAWAAAWHSIRSRQLDLATFGPGGLAARALADVLVECQAPPEAVQEVIALYRGLPPERGRELVWAPELCPGHPTPNRPSACGKVVAVARAMATGGSGPVPGA